MKTEINLNDISGLKKDPSGYLEMIYQNYRDEGMHWMMNKYKCNENDAKEIVQDAVVQLYENVASGKLTNLTSSIKTYLFSICKYKYFEYQRGQRKHVGLMEHLDEIPDADNSEVHLEYETKINKIKLAIVFDQLVNQALTSLVMNIVVPGAVN